MRKCPVCSRADAAEINRRIVAGEPAKDLARELKLPYTALAHHSRAHIPKLLALIDAEKKKAHGEELHKEQLESLQDVVFENERIRRKVWDLCEKAEKGGDLRAAIGACNVLGQNLAHLVDFLERFQESGAIQSREEQAQAVRDLYGIEMPDRGDKVLGAEIVRELSPASGEPAARQEPAAPPPVQEETLAEHAAKTHAAKTRAEIAALRKPAAPGPQAARRDEEARELDRIHKEGRRAEAGELSGFSRKPGDA